MKKKKKERKCYLSCRNIQKMKLQSALLTRYQLMFTDALEEADIFIAPMDNNILSEKQRRDFERAEVLGIGNRIALSSEKIFDQDVKDPLNLEVEYGEEKREIKENEFEESDGLELGLM